MSSSVRFLFIRFSSIGDIVLTSPVVRCLKKQLQGAVIHYVTKSIYADILCNNPYIDKVFVYDNNLKELADQLKEENYDYIIDLHHNLRTLQLKSKLKIIDFSFKKLNIQKWLMVNFKINRLPELHIVDRYLDTVKLFDIENDNKGLDFFIPEKDEMNLSKIPEIAQFIKQHKGYIALVIGAKHFTKRMPVEKLVTICQKINYPVVILGGKEDESVGKEIVQKVGSKVFNVTGKYNLNQSASLIRQSKCVITHDTGLMHIAAAFQKKIISIWGNTIPAFGMYPYFPDKESIMVEVKDLKCRPCSKIGFKKCPKKHFRCMMDIDVDIIVNKALQFVE